MAAPFAAATFSICQDDYDSEDDPLPMDDDEQPVVLNSLAALPALSVGGVGSVGEGERSGKGLVAREEVERGEGLVLLPLNPAPLPSVSKPHIITGVVPADGRDTQSQDTARGGLLISDNRSGTGCNQYTSHTGFKGVTRAIHHGRHNYSARCQTWPCSTARASLGIFDTAKEAAQVYLRHWEQCHSDTLEKLRSKRMMTIPLETLALIKDHQLIQSDAHKTGFMGVTRFRNRYRAICITSPCHRNLLGAYDTPEQAAQMFLYHHQQEHPGLGQPSRKPPGRKPGKRMGWLRLFQALHKQEETCGECDRETGPFADSETETEEVPREGASPTHLQPAPRLPGFREDKRVAGTLPKVNGICSMAKVLVNAANDEWREEHAQHQTVLMDMQPLAGADDDDAHNDDADKKKGGEVESKRQLSEVKLPSSQPAFKLFKQEFIGEGHSAAVQQVVSAVESVAQCGICLGTMMQASTVSGCGHTFCRSCIEEALRVKGCCPQCLLPAWLCDIRDSRRVSAIMDALVGERDHVGAGEQYRASLVKSAAGPTPHVVYDLFNQIVSIKDPDHATGYRPKFYFVLEYKVMMLCVVPLFFCFGFACPLGAFLVDY